MNWQEIGSILGYVGNVIIILVVFTYKVWFPKLFQHSLDKKLAEHKTNLETLKNIKLSEYNKSITGFNKFIDRKYEVYPKLFIELQKVQGEIFSNWERQYFRDFKKYSNENFKGLLNTFNFSVPDKIDLIDKHIKKTITDMDFYELLPGHIRVCIKQANNYFQSNRIFLSSNVDKIVNEILAQFEEARSGYFGVYNSIKKNPAAGEKIKPAYNASSEKILVLLNQMRSELEHNLHDLN